MKGVGWERCQFCSLDILAEDEKWVQHAERCSMLPSRKKNEDEDE
jgi:hypothetical protein